MTEVQRILSEDVEAELLRHPKQWAALTSSSDGEPYDRIIGFGSDPATVFAAAEAAGVQTPLLWRVPDPDVLHFYGAGILPTATI